MDPGTRKEDAASVGENRRDRGPRAGPTVAILQSNYVPWKGYFDLIRRVDEFILYDEVQYTRRDWRNRNRIKTSSGVQWLTIPVRVSGRFDQKISETRIADSAWARRHWKTLSHAYSRASGFEYAAQRFERFYREASTDRLSEVNESLIRIVCESLGIQTTIRSSAAFRLDAEDPTDRLVSICQQAGAVRYLSGPAAHAYLDESRFEAAGIDVIWMDYDGYPQYQQLHGGPFEHHLSVLDLLFNMGDKAREYLLPVLNRRGAV